MKRAAEEELLQDVAKYARIHATVEGGGDDEWTVDKTHALNDLLGACPAFNFFFSGEYPIENTMEIYVDAEACGTLAAADGAKLLRKGAPAPFGKGGETVLDSSVRHAFAIDSARVKIGDTTSFEAIVGADAVDAFCAWLCRDEPQVEFRLYKLHVYPDGGHFAPHRDTPHGGDHVATAIVELPTGYAAATAGVLVVTHGSEERRVAPAAPGHLRVAGFYTDCVHSVSAVSAGHRVVLQYDVFARRAACEPRDDSSDNAEEPFAAPGTPPRDLEATPAVLHALVDGVRSELDRGHNVALLLQHLYFSDDGLAPALLKNDDKVLWDTLSSAGLDVHLQACVMREEEVSRDERDTVERVSGIGILNEHDTLFIPGRDLAGLLRVSHQDGADYTGNEALMANTTYLAAAIVVAVAERAEDKVAIGDAAPLATQ
jgi:hypothetical protein